MEAKDLRIGNIVQDKKIKKPKKIVMFLGTQDLTLDEMPFLGYEEEFYDLSIDKIEPIPITEEWLLEFGFEVIYRSNYTLRFDHKENFKFGAGWNLVNNHFHIRFFGENFTHIKYVHQLQNLYFALTGEEL